VAEFCIRNPFSLGIVQNADDFCNRVDEKKELMAHAINGDNVVLYSPRRYGKSSLVGRVQEELENKGYRSIYVDLFPVISENDFLLRIARALYRGLGKGINPKKFMEKAGDFFRMLTVEITHEGYKFYARAETSVPTEQQIEDLLAGMNSYVTKNKLRVIVVLDEFQEILCLPQAKRLEGILRSQMQRHRDISYFYVGSRRRVLQDMFSNKSRPFYKSAFSFILKEIPKTEFVPFIMVKFTNSGKMCPQDAAEEIYDLVRGYPYYVQKICSIIWDITDVKVSIPIVQDAYAKLVKAEKTEFDGIWSGLSLNQKKLLRAIAEEPTSSPYGKNFIAKYDLSVGGAQGAMKVLLNMDILEQYGAKKRVYRVTDPIMGAWAKSA
jgi:hypothetical protein